MEQANIFTYLKLTVITILFGVIFFVQIPFALAAEPTSTPVPQQQTQWTNQFTVDDKPSDVIVLLKNFIEGFDSFLGGFIFYTPNPLTDTITLKDNSEIPGVTKYRNMFYQIAIPILAIVIAAIAITKLGSDNAQELKSFAFRFIITIVLFITVPHVLSYSIQFNNLLVDKISSTQQFTGFLNEYLDKSQEEISSGANSEQFGIPQYDISLFGGIFKSLGKFIVQVFLFALTFLFLLGGFIYLGFQFVIRFATLLFLGVIFPIIIPFALSERTQGIVYTFFKSWFTFLIQQPAFVLGFAIATDIFTSILQAKGPSVGMLFFYTGFLFFLGGVNMLVGRIFGDAWSVMSNNMQASFATRSAKIPAPRQARDFKHGLLGNNSVSYTAGRNIHNWWTKRNHDETTENGEIKKNVKGEAPPRQNGFAPPTTVPQYSDSLSGKGFEVTMQNQRQGIVSVSGEAYQYEDKKTGLSSIYPTRLEAIQDGVPEDKLQKVMLDQEQFIDMSSFSKGNQNPHNFNAMQESRRMGKDINYAHVNESSPSHKVRHFLEVSKPRNEALGIKGVIVKRQGAHTSDQIIRMYTHKAYEKRKNI